MGIPRYRPTVLIRAGVCVLQREDRRQDLLHRYAAKQLLDGVFLKDPAEGLPPVGAADEFLRQRCEGQHGKEVAKEADIGDPSPLDGGSYFQLSTSHQRLLHRS